MDEEETDGYWQDTEEGDESVEVRTLLKGLGRLRQREVGPTRPLTRKRPNSRTHCVGRHQREEGPTRSLNGESPRDGSTKPVAVTMTKSQKIEIMASRKRKEKTFEEIVPEHLRRFRRVFMSGKKTRTTLPQSRIFDHAITMKPGFEPRRFKHYRLNPKKRS